MEDIGRIKSTTTEEEEEEEGRRRREKTKNKKKKKKIEGLSTDTGRIAIHSQSLITFIEVHLVPSFVADRNTEDTIVTDV